MANHDHAIDKDPIVPAKSTAESSIVGDESKVGGQPLPTAVRGEMEGRFGHSFGDVRIHADQEADTAARAVDADAFTTGSRIAFRSGQYAPETPAGQQLLAHELAHVVQQRGARPSGAPAVNADPHMEREADLASIKAGIPGAHVAVNQRAAGPMIQRQKPIQRGGATPGTGEGIDLIFIIRAPDDEFTANVTSYVQTVLKGQTFVEVDNLDEAVAYLKRLIPGPDAAPLAAGSRVRRIRIVAHGSTTGEIKMTPKGEKGRRWVKPDEIETLAQNPDVQSTMAAVMSPDAETEFWGCNVGNVPKTGEAVAGLFRSSFAAPTETFKTGFDKYFRRPDPGEDATIPEGLSEKAIQVTNTSEVDSRNKALQDHFKAWLLARHTEFVANGDLPPLKTEAERLTAMRDLFNRARGELRFIQIEKGSTGEKFRPGQRVEFLKLWKKTPRPAAAPKKEPSPP